MLFSGPGARDFWGLVVEFGVWVGVAFGPLPGQGVHAPGVGADLMRNGEIPGLHGVLL